MDSNIFQNITSEKGPQIIVVKMLSKSQTRSNLGDSVNLPILFVALCRICTVTASSLPQDHLAENFQQK